MPDVRDLPCGCARETSGIGACVDGTVDGREISHSSVGSERYVGLERGLWASAGYDREIFVRVFLSSENKSDAYYSAIGSYFESIGRIGHYGSGSLCGFKCFSNLANGVEHISGHADSGGKSDVGMDGENVGYGSRESSAFISGIHEAGKGSGVAVDETIGLNSDSAGSKLDGDSIPEWRKDATPLANDDTGDVSRHGKWYKKNKKTRDRRKNKNRSNVESGDCGASESGGTATDLKSGFGYFSDCPLDQQKELKQTRAALLIMENKRRMVEEQAKMRFMESPGYLLKETIAAAKTQAQVEKVLGGSKIGGWASTVASSSLEDVARRAPSNVPSLESIGFGKSALRSSDGSSEGTETSRRSEYLQKKEDLMLCYHLPNPDVEELRGKLYALDLLYEDVMYSPEEKIKRDAVEDVCRMLVGVVGTNKLSDIYTAMGMEDDARYA